MKTRITLLLTMALLTLVALPVFADLLKSGTEVPGFRLSAINGEMVALVIREQRLSIISTPPDGKGAAAQSSPKAALLFFLQPGCRVCHEEMLHLQKLHEKYVKDGLMVLGISMSPMENLAKQTAERLGVTYPILKGADSVDAQKCNTASCPVYVVDGGGIIRSSQTGFTKGDEKKWEQTIQTLLNAATPPKQK